LNDRDGPGTAGHVIDDVECKGVKASDFRLLVVSLNT
jgi:hypothetical protein